MSQKSGVESHLSDLNVYCFGMKKSEVLKEKGLFEPLVMFFISCLNMETNPKLHQFSI